MTTRPTHILALFAAILLLGLARAAAGPPEIIELHWRSAEQLLPILRPLVDDPSAVSGSGRTLFVRAAPDRLDALKDVVRHLDRAPRQLLIYVFQGRADQIRQDTLAGRGDRTASRRLQTRGQLDSTRRIRVSDGQQAFIATEKVQPLPYTLHPTGPYGLYPAIAAGYRETRSGFLVRPVLNGRWVSLDIRTAMAGAGSWPEQQGASTRITAKLGVWVPLTATMTADPARDAPGIRRHSTRSQVDNGLFVKVQLLP